MFLSERNAANNINPVLIQININLNENKNLIYLGDLPNCKCSTDGLFVFYFPLIILNFYKEFVFPLLHFELKS